jgi:hypothetical protein
MYKGRYQAKQYHTVPKNLKQKFPDMKLRSLVPNFYIHVSVSDLYIPTIGPPIFLYCVCGLILGKYKSHTDTVKTGNEAVISGNLWFKFPAQNI